MSTIEPNNPNRMNKGRPLDDRRPGMGMLSLLGALLVAAIVGIGIWSMADNDRTASNTSPGTTTGSTSGSGSAPARTGTPPAAPAGTGTPAAPASR